MTVWMCRFKTRIRFKIKEVNPFSLYLSHSLTPAIWTEHTSRTGTTTKMTASSQTAATTKITGLARLLPSPFSRVTDQCWFRSGWDQLNTLIELWWRSREDNASEIKGRHSGFKLHRLIKRLQLLAWMWISPKGFFISAYFIIPTTCT